LFPTICLAAPLVLTICEISFATSRPSSESVALDWERKKLGWSWGRAETSEVRMGLGEIRTAGTALVMGLWIMESNDRKMEERRGWELGRKPWEKGLWE